MAPTSPVAQRAAFVTGGNRGIGLCVVRSLVEAGLHVFMGCRDLSSVPALAGTEPVLCDVCDAESLTAAAETVRAQKMELHVLVVNAGKSRPTFA